MTGDHVLCGLRVRSAIPLPELPPWIGDAATPPDIHIRLGEVHAAAAHEVSPFLGVTPDGDGLLSIDSVARFLVRDGREVIIAPRVDPSSSEIRVFLLGTVFGLICHQRGLFPLHASCLRVGDATVAFAGQSGAGKSTMAAMLIGEGAELLADDITVIDFSDGTARVRRAIPRVKLWRDSLERLAVPFDGLERNRPGQDKFQWRPPWEAHQAPIRLQALYLLERSAAGRPAGVFNIDQPAARTAAIVGQIYRREAGDGMGRGPGMFGDAARLAGAIAVRRLVRDLDNADAWTPRRLLDDLGAL